MLLYGCVRATFRNCTILFLFAACGGHSFDDPATADWRAVLAQKRLAARAVPPNDVVARQAYADALANFVSRYPRHARGAEVYEALVLDHAESLVVAGRIDAAVGEYQWVLSRNAKNERARSGLARAIDRRSVSRDEAADLVRGMSPAAVRKLLGSPLPGWTRTLRSGARPVEAWYYEKEGGGVVGVFFEGGKLFAVEFDGLVPLRR